MIYGHFYVPLSKVSRLVPVSFSLLLLCCVSYHSSIIDGYVISGHVPFPFFVLIRLVLVTFPLLSSCSLFPLSYIILGDVMSFSDTIIFFFLRKRYYLVHILVMITHLFYISNPKFIFHTFLNIFHINYRFFFTK